MATHPIDLINSALVRLRESPLTLAQYTAEHTGGVFNQAAANQKAWKCLRIFYDLLPAVLRKHTWTCVTRRAELVEDTTNTPAFGFSKRYALPADFVRMVTLWDSAGYEITNEADTTFRIEDIAVSGVTTRTLVTNLSAVNIRYVYQAADLTAGYLDKFDGSLREALIKALVDEYTYAITGSTTLVQIQMAKRKQELDDARIIDSQEEGTEGVESHELLDCRW